MTIADMHLSVKNQVNKLATTAHQNLSPEQIDLLLNRAQDMFIKQRYENNNIKRKGLEESQKRIDDLRILLKRLGSMTIVGVEASGIYGTIVDTWKTVLPVDYMFLVESETKVWGDICGTTDVDAESTKTTVGLCTARFSLPYTPASGSTAVITISYSGNNNASVVPMTTLTIPYTDANDVVTAILNATYVYTTGGYQFEALPGSVTDTFKFCSSTYMDPLLQGIRVTYTVITSSGVSSSTSTYAAFYYDTNEVLSTLQTYTPITKTSLAGTYTRNVNQHVQHDDLGNVLRNSFAKPYIEQPVIVIEENFIYIYTDGTYMPLYEYIVYIRKPAQMDVTTGVNCELPYHTHNEIIDIAVQSILEIIESVRIQTHHMETSKQE